jgi:hypothetical protein
VKRLRVRVHNERDEEEYILNIAHSPKEMKRHYALRNWDALHAAIEEMGRRLGIESWSTTTAGNAN